MTEAVAISKPSRGIQIVHWTLQVLLALAFLAAGLSKATGQPAMIALFNEVGFGQWFRYVTAAVEILGAVLLLVPRTAVFGAVLVAVTMVGAVLTHLVLIGGSAVPALVLFVLSLVVVWLRRGELSFIRKVF